MDQRANKASVEGCSSPQELEISPHSGLYLLVLVISEMKLTSILNHSDFDWKLRRNQPKVTEMFLAIVEKLMGLKPNTDYHSPVKKAANSFSMRAKKMKGGSELDFQAKEKSWLENYEIDEGDNVIKDAAMGNKEGIRVINEDVRLIKEVGTVIEEDEGNMVMKKGIVIMEDNIMMEGDGIFIEDSNNEIEEDDKKIKEDHKEIEEDHKEIREDHKENKEDDKLIGKKVGESDEESRIQTLREKIVLAQKMSLQYKEKRKKIMIMKEAKLKHNHNLKVR